jgi:hypothetical protein
MQRRRSKNVHERGRLLHLLAELLIRRHFLDLLQPLLERVDSVHRGDDPFATVKLSVEGFDEESDAVTVEADVRKAQTDEGRIPENGDVPGGERVLRLRVSGGG